MGCLRRWSIFYVAIKKDLSKCNTNHIDKDSRKKGQTESEGRQFSRTAFPAVPSLTRSCIMT